MDSKVIIDIHLTREQLQSAFEFSGLNWKNSDVLVKGNVKTTHPISRASRAFLEHHLYETIRKRYPQHLIVDVGGAKKRHIQNKRTMIHCLDPTISNHDVFRNEILDTAEITSCNCTFQQHLANPCQLCSFVQNRVYLFIDTLYYVTPDALIQVLLNENVDNIYSVSHKFLGARGSILNESNWWRTGEMLDQVSMTINNETNNSVYQHSACDWLFKGCHTVDHFGDKHMTWRFLNNTAGVFVTEFKLSPVPTPALKFTYDDILRAPANAVPFTIIDATDSQSEYSRWCYSMTVIGDHLILRWHENIGWFNTKEKACIVDRRAVQFVSLHVCSLERSVITWKTAVSSAKMYFKNAKLQPSDQEIMATAIAALFLGFKDNGKMLNSALEGSIVARVHYNNAVGGFISRKLTESRLKNLLSIVSFILSQTITWFLPVSFKWKVVCQFVLNFLTFMGSRLIAKKIKSSLTVSQQLMASNNCVRKIVDTGSLVTIKAECFSLEGSHPMREGCKCSEPTTLRCDPNTIKQSLQVYRPCLWSNCRLAASCSHNAYRSFATRQAQLRDPIDPAVMLRFKAFNKEFIERLNIVVTNVMSYDDWNAAYPEVKRNANNRAMEKLKTQGLGALDFPRDKSFVKSEIILKDPKEDPEYDPRLITGVETEYNVVIGPMMATVREILKSLFNVVPKTSCPFATFTPMPGIVFSCGMNKEALGKLVNEKVTQFHNFKAVETDFSRYDGSLQKEILEDIEHEFYIALFTAIIKQILNLQLISGGKIGNPFNTLEELIEFIMDYCRRTGEQNTTNGNSWINLLITLFGFDEQCQNGVRVWDLLIELLLALVFLGDDNLSMTDGVDLDENKFVTLTKKLGLNIKLKKPKPQDMTFCSNLFIPSADGLIATQYPGRLLSKAFVTRNKFTEVQANQWVYDQATNYSKDAGHLDFLRVWFEDVAKVAKPNKRVTLHDIDRANSTTELFNLHCERSHNSNKDTSNWLQGRYGLTPFMHARLCKYMLKWKDHQFRSLDRPCEELNWLNLIVRVDLGYEALDPYELIGRKVDSFQKNEFKCDADITNPRVVVNQKCMLPDYVQALMTLKPTRVKEHILNVKPEVKGDVAKAKPLRKSGDVLTRKPDIKPANVFVEKAGKVWKKGGYNLRAGSAPQKVAKENTAPLGQPRQKWLPKSRLQNK